MADPNPYHQDPYLASIVSNLSRAFIDKNPGKTMLDREHAGVLGLQADKLAREAQRRSAIASTFRNLNGRAPTAQEFANITADSIEGDMKPADTSGHILMYQSNTAQPDSTIARAFVGSGRGLNKGEAVSLGDRENIRTLDAANDKARTDSSAGIAAGASRANNRDNIAFHERTRFDAPIHVSPGSGLILNPEDKRTPSTMRQGEVAVPVPARPTADRFVQSADPADPSRNIWRQVQDGINGPAPIQAKPPALIDISPREIADLEFQAIHHLDGIDGTGDSAFVNPHFRKLFGPKMEAAKQAAAAEYQRTRSAADGIRAYREHLGVPVGAAYERPSWFGFAGNKMVPSADPSSPIQQLFSTPGSQRAASPQTVPIEMPPPLLRRQSASRE